MKLTFTLLFLTLLQFMGHAQESFTSRKGSKFFPGHLDVVITVDATHVRYELYNHWYASSYAALRQLTIPLDSLNGFNQKNDSIKITLDKGKVTLVDKKYGLSKRIKHKKLCAPVSTMRKISFATELSKGYKDLKNFELYNYDDLMLDEEAFQQKVMENLKEKTK